MMERELSNRAAAPKRELKYWDEIIQAPERRYGPIVFSSSLLDQLLDLMGEKHPIHDSDTFAQGTERKQRIIPGGFIHSITSGWIVQHGAPAAIVGLKSLTWDFVRPLYPDVPFYFTTQVEYSEEINSRLGLVKTLRRVTDEAGNTLAIGRMTAVMQRKSTQANNIKTLTLKKEKDLTI